jgi:nicotinamide riboside kinase
MSGRIGIIGGECSGKSTLARHLARDLPACLVPEELRSFVERHGRPPSSEEQADLLARQARAEDAAAGSCAHPWLVADPAPLMTAVYSVLYFDDPSLLPQAVAHARGYDLVVWCDPDIPWQPDPGQRDGADLRAAAEAVIAEVVRDLLIPAAVQVLRVSGDEVARVTSVRDALDRAWRPEPPDGAT